VILVNLEDSEVSKLQQELIEFEVDCTGRLGG